MKGPEKQHEGEAELADHSDASEKWMIDDLPSYLLRLKYLYGGGVPSRTATLQITVLHLLLPRTSVSAHPPS